MDEAKDYFLERKEFSEGEIEKFRKFYKKNATDEVRGISVYITGSFGRKEARPESDVDLFFISETKEMKREAYINYLSYELQKDMGFPEFTDGGIFLVTHQIDKMLEDLGSPSDDFNNYFTARMLLLLESQCLHGEEIYKKAKNRVLEFYFRDIKGKEESFRPIFLLNDLIRYWRTICLNYEEKRTKYFSKKDDGEDEPRDKAKQKLKNKKLKFNRLWLCMSAIAPMITKEHWTLDEMEGLFSLTPYERLSNYCNKNDLVEKATIHYMKFLKCISDVNNQNKLENPDDNIWGEVNKYAEDFREKIIEIIKETSDEKMESFLLV